ncbi:MAG: phospho-sugar mutase [Myxococcota bacterium]
MSHPRHPDHPMNQRYRHLIDAYLHQEPCQGYRDCIAALDRRAREGDADATRELAWRFQPLTFGTAGLRALMGAGDGLMNRVTVARVAWALGQHLLARAREPGRRNPCRQGIVIGHDARHGSEQFAQDMAAVLTGLGLHVHVFDSVTATPLCAFATKHLGAVAGVMVTASHNPAGDNGIKFYRADGTQINEDDSEPIAAWLARSPALGSMSRLSTAEQYREGPRHDIAPAVTDAYLAAMDAWSLHPQPPASLRKQGSVWIPAFAGMTEKGCAQDDKRGAARTKNSGKQRHAVPSLRIVYTPLHGVGGEPALRALARAGFTDVHVVPRQAAPDGDFPTAPAPNPENPRVLRLAMELADKVDADLILANDPDADRLAVCARHPRTGAWEPLSGDAVGVLLGHAVIERFCCSQTRRDAINRVSTAPGHVVSTIVSSRMLERIAGHYGLHYVQALTGFRHIAAASRRLSEAGKGRFVFGYEESLGYCVGDTVLEKDGIAAAVRCSELASRLLARGRTLHEQLDQLALRWGLHQGGQFSVGFAGPAAGESMRAVMRRLREDGGLADTLAGSSVVRRLDLLEQPLAGHRAADVLVFHLADGGRWIARPSGTEPKVKFYVEYVRSVGTLAQLDAARAELSARIQALRERVLKGFGGESA